MAVERDHEGRAGDQFLEETFQNRLTGDPGDLDVKGAAEPDGSAAIVSRQGIAALAEKRLEVEEIGFGRLSGGA